MKVRYFRHTKVPKIIFATGLLLILSGCSIEKLIEKDDLLSAPPGQSFQISQNATIEVSVVFVNNLKWFTKVSPSNNKFLEEKLVLQLANRFKDEKVIVNSGSNGGAETIVPEYLVSAKVVLLDYDSITSGLLSVITLGIYPYQVMEHYSCDVEIKNVVTGKSIKISRSFDIFSEHSGPLSGNRVGWTEYVPTMISSLVATTFAK